MALDTGSYLSCILPELRPQQFSQYGDNNTMSHIIKPFCSFPVPLLLVILVLITDVLMKFLGAWPFLLSIAILCKGFYIGKVEVGVSQITVLTATKRGPNSLSTLKNSSGKLKKGSNSVSISQH